MRIRRSKWPAAAPILVSTLVTFDPLRAEEAPSNLREAIAQGTDGLTLPYRLLWTSSMF